MESQQSRPEVIPTPSIHRQTFANSTIGEGVKWLLFGCAVALIFAGYSWDGYLYSKKGCVTLQELSNNRLMKVDSCSGEIQEIGLGSVKSPLE